MGQVNPSSSQPLQKVQANQASNTTSPPGPLYVLPNQRVGSDPRLICYESLQAILWSHAGHLQIADLAYYYALPVFQIPSADRPTDPPHCCSVTLLRVESQLNRVCDRQMFLEHSFSLVSATIMLFLIYIVHIIKGSLFL